MTEALSYKDHETLAHHLARQEALGHAVENPEVIETHISWVVLTGPHAYKIKKPVDMGFLDFSTLQKRHFYCQEELRLNRRLAEGLYLDVVAIGGSPHEPRVTDEEPTLEYAVKMAQFPAEEELDRVLERGELAGELLDDLARRVAVFHDEIDRIDDVEPSAPWGQPDTVWKIVEANFTEIASRLDEHSRRSEVQTLHEWTRKTHDRLRETFTQRRAGGHVRECHGDMHLQNMVRRDGRVLVFDGIEFNESFRWIDTINEVAFLLMDLDSRGHPELASRFLNVYLEEGGDHEAIALLRYYKTYRALVRAKVAAIRYAQESPDDPDRSELLERFEALVDLASRYIERTTPTLEITHGLSGSGKSVYSRSRAASHGALRIAADVERKRLHGLKPSQKSDSPIDGGIYSAEATERTYARLADLARTALEAGHSVLVDASFLRRSLREQFRSLARELGVAFRILDFDVPPDILRERVAERARRSDDPSEATLDVLRWQQRNQDPLDASEKELATEIDTTD